jgi:hypothetical protein
LKTFRERCVWGCVVDGYQIEICMKKRSPRTVLCAARLFSPGGIHSISLSIPPCLVIRQPCKHDPIAINNSEPPSELCDGHY